MPRSIRARSETGLYHATVRGVGQQRLFEEDEDYAYFLNVVGDACDMSGNRVLAYCLMTNHAHLLVEEHPGTISNLFRRVGTRYAAWFNKKYDHEGHVFQGRFHSEPVQDDAYFTTVVTYIHLNPVRAGLSPTASDYPWSSRRVLDTETDKLVDVDRLRELADLAALRALETSSAADQDLPRPSRGRRPRHTDAQADDMLKEVSACASTAEFQALPAPEQAVAVVALRDCGVAIRQVARITGLPKGLIERWGQHASSSPT
jgi:REP element-mobilizing transposase RayT